MLKSTGAYRRIDELHRLNIPATILSKLKANQNDAIEFCVDSNLPNTIVIRKYLPENDLLRAKTVCDNCAYWSDKPIKGSSNAHMCSRLEIPTYPAFWCSYGRDGE